MLCPRYGLQLRQPNFTLDSLQYMHTFLHCYHISTARYTLCEGSPYYALHITSMHAQLEKV